MSDIGSILDAAIGNPASSDNTLSDNNPQVADLVTNSRLLVEAVNAVAQSVTNTFPRIVGTFALSASATTTVTQTSMQSTGVPLFTPTNAAAATLMAGAGSLYVSNRVTGVGFAVTTANGSTPAGVETFVYSVINPST